MPPLPVSFDEATLTTIESLQRRKRDLSEYQIPRLRKCAGPLAVQQRLAGELREDLDTFTRHVEVSRTNSFMCILSFS
jgi:protein transport protein SEC20